MCYDKAYLSKSVYNYARLYTNDAEKQKLINSQLSIIPPRFYASGFSHPQAPIITDLEPDKVQSFSWGLIPFWVKDNMSAVKLSNQCLNARGETIFEKPAFRDSAKNRRCLITCIDGYYEYYHQEKKTYPFFIQSKDKKPLTFAGLWSRWENKADGIVRETYTVVTTKANELVGRIHNNPKREEGDSRMPVMLTQELQWQWLNPINDNVDKSVIQELIQPYPDDLLEAYPVGQLKGKNGIGNSEAAMSQVEYEELIPFQF
jgi:putative SOS response-associated peptidase YedK